MRVRPPASLAQATYYWRLRAVDKAGNVSLWSEVRVFHLVAGNTIVTTPPPLPTPVPTQPPPPCKPVEEPATPEPPIIALNRVTRPGSLLSGQVDTLSILKGPPSEIDTVGELDSVDLREEKGIGWTEFRS